ncbi:protein obstructor-E [Lutzomyia longipalpis]|uniref:protein obstructor-E n=1 Tax=Lutzomyia longipalpis TaxID=7200 RepID=UPI002484394C|nr:protein obstructor-E [Lutzomyia longipalpis]
MMQYVVAICCSLFALQVVAQFNEAQRFNAFGAFRQPLQQTSQPLQRSHQCPEANGRYPVSGQCDAYIECRDGVSEEKLCPDGLLFNEKAGVFTYPCSYPIDVECPQGRTSLQAAQSTDECPHQFGYYRLGDASHCGQFMNCVNGKGFVFDCPEGLAFNAATYRCDWADQVPDCDAEAFLGFTCPPEARVEGLGQGEARFFRSPHDCQRYFLCLEGRPRLHTCGEGQAFNELTNACDGIENVTSCYTPQSNYRQAQPVTLPPPPPPPPTRAFQAFQQQPFQQNPFHQQRRPQPLDTRGSFRF